MKKIILVLVITMIQILAVNAANGDTTYLRVFDSVAFTKYGNFDRWGVDDVFLFVCN